MLLTVPVFLVAGSSLFALRIVPIVLSGVAAFLVWRVGRRTIGEPAAGVAGALFWIWPPFTLFLVTRQQGFYASNLVYGSRSCCSPCGSWNGPTGCGPGCSGWC